MASRSDVIFAQLQQDEMNKFQEGQRRQNSSLQNRSNKMGVGRFFGAVGGGLLALATGGGSLLVGAAAGLGSRLGSEVAQQSTKIDEVEKGKLYRRKTQMARDMGIQAQRDLNRRANVNALSDAFSGYTLAGTTGGKTLQNFLQEGSREGLRDAIEAGAINAADIEGTGVRAGLKRVGERVQSVQDYFKSFSPNSEIAPVSGFNALAQAMNTKGVDTVTKRTMPASAVDLVTGQSSPKIGSFMNRNFQNELEKLRQSQMTNTFNTMNTDDYNYNRTYGIAPMLGDIGREY
jgi:hypothetical protein